VSRPPVAAERLTRLEDGRLLYRLKQCWRDGTTHVVFEPAELMEKLAAIVPRPRFHLVRYQGVLGLCASERDRIAPVAIDVLACPRCGGRLRLLAAIHSPDVQHAILDCLGLPPRAPPPAAADAGNSSDVDFEAQSDPAIAADLDAGFDFGA
jgi:hypothetical protein